MTIIAMGPESARGDCAVVISSHPDLVAIENFERSSGIDKIPNALQYRLTILASSESQSHRYCNFTVRPVRYIIRGGVTRRN